MAFGFTGTSLKKGGLKLLRILKMIVRKQIIVWVPAGLLLQDAGDDNRYQKHISEWNKNDFKKIGYSCEVIKNYHHDIRKYSRKLHKYHQPIPADAMWAIWIKK